MLIAVSTTLVSLSLTAPGEDFGPRPWVGIRGVYGGVPEELLGEGQSLPDLGINAVWVGSGSVTEGLVSQLHDQGVRVFAEFNTLHMADYIKEHPDAAPVGVDGEPCPPPHEWQGVSPTHEGYRRFRMDAFRELLERFDVDGVWLDYHHAHASWERDVPAMPDVGFDERSLGQFQRDTGIELPEAPMPECAQLLLTDHREAWVQWRCDVLTDWVREFAQIRDEVRPEALLGTFHCPWSLEDYDGALREKLHIDLRAQAEWVDVFSPMPYHARFGHAKDPEWISRQVAWLGEYLSIEGREGERHRIWPIAQLSDWGETVAPEDIPAVLGHATRRPATGVLVFAWGGLREQAEKHEPLVAFYQAIAE